MKTTSAGRSGKELLPGPGFSWNQPEDPLHRLRDIPLYIKIRQILTGYMLPNIFRLYEMGVIRFFITEIVTVIFLAVMRFHTI